MSEHPRIYYGSWEEEQPGEKLLRYRDCLDKMTLEKWRDNRTKFGQLSSIKCDGQDLLLETPMLETNTGIRVFKGNSDQGTKHVIYFKLDENDPRIKEFKDFLDFMSQEMSFQIENQPDLRTVLNDTKNRRFFQLGIDVYNPESTKDGKTFPPSINCTVRNNTTVFDAYQNKVPVVLAEHSIPPHSKVCAVIQPAWLNIIDSGFCVSYILKQASFIASGGGAIEELVIRGMPKVEMPPDPDPIVPEQVQVQPQTSYFHSQVRAAQERMEEEEKRKEEESRQSVKRKPLNLEVEKTESLPKRRRK